MHDVPFELHEPPPLDAQEAFVYVRPHQLDLQREPTGSNALSVTTKLINAAGPHVKIELLTAWGQTVTADLSHERFRELKLHVGQTVFLSTKEMKVFHPTRASAA